MKLAWASLLVCSLHAAAEQATPQEWNVERVASHLSFTDSPLWSREGFLLFSDVPSSRILQIAPNEKMAPFREETNGTAGMTFDAQGRLYLCEGRTHRLTRLEKSGKLDVLAEQWQGKRLNGPNDVVVRKDGHVYFTDPAFGYQQDKRELDFYGVFHLTPKGELSVIAKPAGRPNGIALSPNGRILYVTNSDEKNIRAYDLDKAGEASGERIVVSGIAGIPNGIRVDEKGQLYVAANNILIYDASGKLISTITTGEPPSNCAFGDQDFGTLYVTGRTEVLRIRLEVKGSVQY